MNETRNRLADLMPDATIADMAVAREVISAEWNSLDLPADAPKLLAAGALTHVIEEFLAHAEAASAADAVARLTFFVDVIAETSEHYLLEPILRSLKRDQHALIEGIDPENGRTKSQSGRRRLGDWRRPGWHESQQAPRSPLAMLTQIASGSVS